MDSAVTGTLGVDLGTSNSLMAYCGPGKSPVALKPADTPSGYNYPSYVSFGPKGEPELAGYRAKHRYGDGTGWTVRHVKRLVGRPHSAVERDMQGGERFLAEFRERLEAAEDGSCQIAVPLGNGSCASITVTDVVRFLLQNILDEAAKKAPDKVERVLVTVPAGFSDNQRQATHAATKLAAERALPGAQVLAPVEEPLAAALAYGLPKQDATIMVVDMGAGTTDIVVARLEWSQDGPALTTSCLACDDALGGLDMDMAILEELYRRDDERRADSSGAVDGPSLREFISEADGSQLGRLLTQIEEAKIAASLGGAGAVVTVLTMQNGASVTRKVINEQFSVSELGEVICRDQIDRCVALVNKAIREQAGGDSEGDMAAVVRSIDHVLPVGGPMAMQPLRDAIAEVFSQNPEAVTHLVELDPNTMKHECAVGLGAAMYGASLRGKRPGPQDVYITGHSSVVPYDISLFIRHDGGHVVMNRGEPYIGRAEAHTTVTLEGRTTLLVLSHPANEENWADASIRAHPVSVPDKRDVRVEFLWDTRGLELRLPELQTSFPVVESYSTFSEHMSGAFTEFLQVCQDASDVAASLRSLIVGHIAAELGLPADLVDDKIDEIRMRIPEVAEDLDLCEELLNKPDILAQAEAITTADEHLDVGELKVIYDSGYFTVREQLAVERGVPEPVTRLVKAHFNWQRTPFNIAELGLYILGKCDECSHSSAATMRANSLLQALVSAPDPQTDSDLRMSLGVVASELQARGHISAQEAAGYAGAIGHARSLNQ